MEIRPGGSPLAWVPGLGALEGVLEGAQKVTVSLKMEIQGQVRAACRGEWESWKGDLVCSFTHSPTHSFTGQTYQAQPLPP